MMWDFKDIPGGQFILSIWKLSNKHDVFSWAHVVCQWSWAVRQISPRTIVDSCGVTSTKGTISYRHVELPEGIGGALTLS